MCKAHSPQLKRDIQNAVLIFSIIIIIVGSLLSIIPVQQSVKTTYQEEVLIKKALYQATSVYRTTSSSTITITSTSITDFHGGWFGKKVRVLERFGLPIGNLNVGDTLYVSAIAYNGSTKIQIFDQDGEEMAAAFNRTKYIVTNPGKHTIWVETILPKTEMVVKIEMVLILGTFFPLYRKIITWEMESTLTSTYTSTEITTNTIYYTYHEQVPLDNAKIISPILGVTGVIILVLSFLIRRR